MRYEVRQLQLQPQMQHMGYEVRGATSAATAVAAATPAVTLKPPPRRCKSYAFLQGSF